MVFLYTSPGNHNPRHLHVYVGDEEFTISIVDRMIDGKALSSTIKLVNAILDHNMDEINAEIAKGDKGEKMSLIKNIK